MHLTHPQNCQFPKTSQHILLLGLKCNAMEMIATRMFSEKKNKKKQKQNG